MKYQALRKAIFIFVGVGAALLSASCAIAPKADGPTFGAAGSSWTIERRDSGSYGSGTAQVTRRALGEQTWQGRKVRAVEGARGTLLSDAVTGRWLAQTKDDKTLVSWEPAFGYDWPLTVGKSFTKDYRFTNHMTNQRTDFKSTFTVESYEDVTVPAGTFKAFKVLYTDSLGETGIYWYCPDIGGEIVKSQGNRNSGFPGGAGTQEIVLLSYNLKK